MVWGRDAQNSIVIVLLGFNLLILQGTVLVRDGDALPSTTGGMGVRVRVNSSVRRAGRDRVRVRART
jgi:hypothetical protein